MRSGNVAEVYEWVVQDVVSKVQEVFVREGVNPTVLHELRALWTAKLKEEQVRSREEDNGSRLVNQQARNRGPEAQQVDPKEPAAAGPLPLHPGAPVPPGLPQQGGPLATGHGVPSGGALAAYSQPGVSQGPFAPVQTIAPQAPSSEGQFKEGSMSRDGGAGAVAPAGRSAGADLGRPEVAANHLDGIPTEPGDLASVEPSVAETFHDGVHDRKRKMEDEALENGGANGAHADVVGQAPASKVQRVNGESAPDDRGRSAERAPRDEDDDDDDELPTDDDDDELVDPPNFLTAQYDKVSRIKNRWRCQLKYGIFHANGKDYLFKNATGDFTF